MVTVGEEMEAIRFVMLFSVLRQLLLMTTQVILLTYQRILNFLVMGIILLA